MKSLDPFSTGLFAAGSAAVVALASTLGKRAAAGSWRLLSGPHKTRRRLTSLEERVTVLEGAVTTSTDLLTKEVLPLLRANAEQAKRTSEQVDHLTQTTVPQLFEKIGEVRGRQGTHDDTNSIG